MGKALPDDLNTLKVTELKEALRERSLTISGVKADLVARLQEYLNKENKEPATSDAQNGAKDDDEQLKEKEQKEKELREKDKDTEEPEKDEETETKEGGKKRKTTDEEEPTQSTPSRTLNHPSSSSSATSPSSPTSDTNKRARSTWTNKPQQSITISSDILKEMLPTPSSPTSTSTPADAEMDDAGGAQDEARTSRPAQAVYSAPSRREKKEEEPAGPREVPASRKPASNTLYIDRFVRPFTIPQVKQLLSQTGEIETFWMNQVKSQAYVTFKTVEQASATREAIFDLAWPPGNGSKLRAEFASEEEAKKAAEQHDLKRSAPTATTAATTPTNVRGDRDVRVVQDSRDSRDLRDSREVRDTRSLRDVRDSRDSRRPAPPPKKTLEDLFKKTVALPSIYWLGLTAEQIAAKKSTSDRDR